MTKQIPIKSIDEILRGKSSEINRRTKIINDINSERNRQDYKWGKQRHDFPTWYVILGEEVGEVAQAIQATHSWGKSSDAQNLYKELIQVAAVATAMAEQVIENDKGARN